MVPEEEREILDAPVLRCPPISLGEICLCSVKTVVLRGVLNLFLLILRLVSSLLPFKRLRNSTGACNPRGAPSSSPPHYAPKQALSPTAHTLHDGGFSSNSQLILPIREVLGEEGTT